MKAVLVLMDDTGSVVTFTGNVENVQIGGYDVLPIAPDNMVTRFRPEKYHCSFNFVRAAGKLEGPVFIQVTTP